MQTSKCHVQKYLEYILILNLLIGFMLAGCSQIDSYLKKSPTPEPIKPNTMPTAAVTSEPSIIAPIISTAGPTSVITSEPSKNQVNITGWFNIIWNSEPHYSITDDQGQITQLLFDGEIARPLGGPLKLNRNRVMIIGEIISDTPRIVRVLSVKFANPK